MYWARFVRDRDGTIRWQELREHSRNAAELAVRAAKAAGLEHIARLAGLMHDFGKDRVFQTYLAACARDPDHPPAKGSAPHSPLGALYAHTRWMNGDDARQAAAQLIALCVLSHHEGLCDCLGPDGSSPYLEKLERAEATRMREAAEVFFRECEPQEALDALFEKAAAEVRALTAKIRQSVEKDARALMLGLVARFLLSCLVDADRWDSACFEAGRDPLLEDQPFDFEEALRRLERRLGELNAPRPNETDLERDVRLLRGELSLGCFAAGRLPPGLYTLTVPTGGGKTLASLRYALRHIRENGLRRIFYIIPFNTILDQNAGAIRRALQMDGAVLEHHANVVLERGDGAEGPSGAEDAWRARQILTERWDSPIILTSMVHFLDSLYLGGNTAARRMQGLAGSVLIFDEVQAVPFHCLSLFKLALTFLTRFLGCSVLLCTATQPLLDRPPFGLSIGGELAGDVDALFGRMRRVTLVDEVRDPPMRAPELADFALALQRVHGGVLVVVNTKAMARAVYEGVKARLPEGAVFLLTTNLCAEHRRDVLRSVEARLELMRREGLPCVLVSTSLIEAGVDISFPCGVRALCGLSSAIQAAGRVNRGGEAPMGYMHFVHAAEELNSLEEIRKGQKRARHVLDEARASGGLDIASPGAIRMYFEKTVYDESENGEQDCPIKTQSGGTDTAVNLLGKNPNGVGSWLQRNGKPPVALRQAFRTVGSRFEVIDQDTQAVLVHYGEEGGALIADLNGEQTPEARRAALRLSQRFAVNLYRGQFRRLCDRGAVCPLGDSGAWALLPAYYDPFAGLAEEPGRMETEIH